MTMEKVAHEDKKFENIDYSEKKLANQVFTSCHFTNCNFTKSDLSNNDFVDCTFNNCNFSLTQLQGAGLKNVQFLACKLVGVAFYSCGTFLFSVSFQDCRLDYSSFVQMKIKKTQFVNCSLKDVDFTEADLSMASFKNCDLLNAAFMRTNLEKADFRDAYNYGFDPELNRIKKAKFSAAGALGLLGKYNIEIE